MTQQFNFQSYVCLKHNCLLSPKMMAAYPAWVEEEALFLEQLQIRSLLYSTNKSLHIYSHIHLYLRGDSKVFHDFSHYPIPAPSSLVFSTWVPVANS